MQSSIKRRVYELVEFVPHRHDPEKTIDWFDISMIALIVTNVVAVIIETIPQVHRNYGRALYIFEAISIGIFSIEYLLRLWSWTESPHCGHRFWGRVRLVFSPMGIIDLLAIVPFYLQLLFPGAADLRFILSLRLLRILRVLKIGRYSRALAMLSRVLKSRTAELSVMLMVLAIVLVIAAGLMYYAEHEKQPEAFSSIPESLWWAVITLTTIGYGDVYPKSELGKLLGGLIAICGIGFVALPTAIVSAGFAEELGKRKKTSDKQAESISRCPHCGKPLDGHLDAAQHSTASAPAEQSRA